jgi:DnaK suppressor protein
LATAKTAKTTAKTTSKISTKALAKIAKPAAPAASKATKAGVLAKAPKPELKSVVSSGLPAPSKISKGGLMSEADLIKQAKTDYMSQDQLNFFKQRLLELAAQLRENAGATTEHLRELAVAPDPADRATLEEEHALELRARDRERKLLKKVEGALVRIENGEYGYCEETGEPIGIQRLLARPTATLTIEAQERRELKQKMYGE